MSISCPSLPLSLFEEILRIDSKFEEGLGKIQNDFVTFNGKLKDNSKEIEIIHKLFCSLNERMNQTNKKEVYIDSSRCELVEQRIENLNKKIDTIENSIKNEIEKSKKDIKEYIDEKTEELHCRLLKNLAFINDQQLRALKNELTRTIPPISPVITPIPNNQTKPNLPIEEEQWTKVDKKNYKPK